MSYYFPTNTRIPTSATHLLCFTSNVDGEMGSGVSVAIDDYVIVAPSLSANVPIARHMAFQMNGEEDITIALSGYDADGNSLVATITSLPTVGKL